MARIEWVRHRLEEWSKWACESEAGSLGYPRASAFARMGPSAGRNEAVVPVNSIAAAEIDDAVRALKLSQPHLHLVLTLTYIKQLPRHLVARTMHRAESTVSANLGQADIAIKLWLDARLDARQNAARGSFTP